MANVRKYGLMITGLILILILINIPEVTAQGCSICSLDAAQQGPDAAKGLNAGILYIAAVPFALIGVIGYQWYKHNGRISEEE
ncbi:MAG: hypothetical protein EPN37_05215 [Chitinophagaceae bacterium]|jgi:hypothetical protein|nr:MAG: hypothetical protein EPN37_05215 [Chitinophagaceae bacterium]